MRQIYTAPTADAAEQQFAEFEAVWGEKYPATGKTAGWKSALNTLTLYYGDRITLG